MYGIWESTWSASFQYGDTILFKIKLNQENKIDAETLNEVLSDTTGELAKGFKYLGLENNINTFEYNGTKIYLYALQVGSSTYYDRNVLTSIVFNYSDKRCGCQGK